MVDIHAHILPHADDGAGSTETSLRMARLALRSGVTDIIATPHSNQRGRFENYADGRLPERFSRLRAVLAREAPELRLHLGMEVYATPDLVPLLRDGKLLTLAGSRYLLVEFGFDTEAGEMTRTLRGLLDASVVPIVAHPERYRALQTVPDYALDWAAAGVHLQINKGSLSGRFGREAHALCLQLLEHDLVSFCASDAHGAGRRTPALDEAWQTLAARYGAAYAQRLLRDNPERVLQNRRLLPCAPIPFGA